MTPIFKKRIRGEIVYLVYNKDWLPSRYDSTLPDGNLLHVLTNSISSRTIKEGGDDSLFMVRATTHSGYFDLETARYYTLFHNFRTIPDTQQGHGYGTVLFKLIQEYLRATEFPNMLWFNRTELQTMYEKLGGEVISSLVEGETEKLKMRMKRK